MIHITKFKVQTSKFKEYYGFVQFA